jgi:hypothetical protein
MHLDVSTIRDFAGPSATIFAAVAAVGITAYFARQTLAVSKEQIRQSRFDRRLEVYLSAAAFYKQLIGWTGTEDQQKAQDRFLVAHHASFFLFDGDATIEAILTELQDMGVYITGYKEHSRELSSDPNTAANMFNETHERLTKHFPVKLVSLRSAMRPYMDVSILTV